MAWRMVLQPNGRLARFSDVVDDFTHMNLTQQQALQVCCEFAMPLDARGKIDRALADLPNPDFVDDDGLPLKRWRQALEQILQVHGKKMVSKRQREGSRRRG